MVKPPMRQMLLSLLLSVLRSLIYVKRGMIFFAHFIGNALWPLVRMTGSSILFPAYYVFARFFKRREKRRALTRIGAVSSTARYNILLSYGAIFGVLFFLLLSESYLFAGEPLRGNAPIFMYMPRDYGELEFGEYVREEEEHIEEDESPYAGTVAGGRSLLIPSMPGIKITPTPPPGKSVASRGRVETYVVAKGDTISAIAQQFGLRVDTILWENKISSRTTLQPGDVLRILPVDGVIYKVARGDTVSLIAQKFDVAVEKIKEVNALNEQGALVAGASLLIPNGKPLIVAQPKASRRDSFVLKAPVSVPRARDSGAELLWPTSGHVITQYYRGRHTGLDIDGHYDSPIYASEDGRIVKAGFNKGGYGLYIVIDHGGGLQTLYAHSSKLFVHTGDTVTRGQVIAMVGTTGRSTGTHLHYEVRINGRRLNPLKYTR